MAEAANEMLDAIRDIVCAELDNMDKVVMGTIVGSAGEDRFLVRLESDPDGEPIVASNSTPYRLSAPEPVFVYQVRNKPEDSFIFAPVATGDLVREF